MASVQVCHARTIHGRSLEEITEAAQSMDTIPSLYPQLDASGLLHETQSKRKQVLCSLLILGLVHDAKQRFCCGAGEGGRSLLERLQIGACRMAL